MKNLMKKLTKEFVLTLLLIATCAVVLTSCGNEVSEISSTLIVRESSDLLGLIPNALADDMGYVIHQNMYHRVVKLDAAYDIIPDLAYNWETSDDGLTMTFFLRNDIYWHDGVQVTSADVKYTFDTIRTTEHYVMFPNLQTVESIDTPDDFTVVFNMNTPDVGFISTLAWYATFVLPMHILDGYCWIEHPHNTEGAIGSGPFMFYSHQMGVGTTLIANPSAPTVPAIERLVFRIIPDDATAVQALMSGEIDVLTNVPTPALEEIRRNSDVQLNLIENPSPSRMLFRADVYPLDNPIVRRAISMTLPRSQISEMLYGGIQAPEYTMYPSIMSWVANFDDLAPYLDIEGARTLLMENGFELDDDGYFVRGITLTIFTIEVYPDKGPLIQASAREAGIEIEVIIYEPGTWFQRVMAEQNFMLTLQGGFMGPDPSAMQPIFSTGGTRNIMGFSDPEVDRLLALGGSVSDTERRAYYYRAAQALMAEHLVHVPLTAFAAYQASNARLRNLPLEGTGRWGVAEFTYAYFVE